MGKQTCTQRDTMQQSQEASSDVSCATPWTNLKLAELSDRSQTQEGTDAGFRPQGVLQEATHGDRTRGDGSRGSAGEGWRHPNGSSCRDGTVPNLACGGRPDLTGHRRVHSLHRKLYVNRNPSFFSQPSCQPQHDLHSSCNSVFCHSIAVRERASEDGRENVQFKNISGGHKEGSMSTQIWLTNQFVGGQGPKTDAASCWEQTIFSNKRWLHMQDLNSLRDSRKQRISPWWCSLPNKEQSRADPTMAAMVYFQDAWPGSPGSSESRHVLGWVQNLGNSLMKQFYICRVYRLKKNNNDLYYTLYLKF